MSEFLHVVENGQRDGEQVYVLVKTYTSWAWLMNFLLSSGRPVWVVRSESESLQVWGHYGNDGAMVWNSGGWQQGVFMPPLRLVDERKGKYSRENILDRQYRQEDARKGWVW